MLADTVKEALESGDIAAFAHLLSPDVRWGPPGDTSPPCRNRQQVLDWYQRGFAEGRRARNVEVTDSGGKLLVSMMVSDLEGASWTSRWQVLTVSEGMISDIRGYDNHVEAEAAARA